MNEGAGQKIRQKLSRARTIQLVALAAFAALVAMLLGGNTRRVSADPQALAFNNPPNIILPAGCSAATINIAEGDVTGDGKPDIVMFCPGGFGVSPAIVTLPGKGDGTFSSPISTTLTTGLQYNGPVALADIDGDGKLDLITEDLTCRIDVFLGNGDGTFQAPVQIPEPDYCSSIYEPFLVADFNGDGRPDLALEDNYGATLPVVTVFLNTSTAGSVSFSTNDVAVATSSSQSITGLAFGNFTGQSVPDLAVGLTTFSGGTTNSVEIWKNNLGGPGNPFVPEKASVLPTTTNTQSLGGIAAGDFNNDGKVDLAAADPGDGTIFVLYGDGAGNLTSCSPLGSAISSCQQAGAGQTITGLSLPSSGGQLLSGKFNGQPGLLFANANDGVSVLLSSAGSSGLQTTAQNYVAGPSSGGGITIGDLNGDGFPDAIVPTNYGLSVLLNNSSGILEGTQAFPAQVFSGGAGPEEMGLLQNFFGSGEQDVVVGQNGDFSGLIDGNTITVLGEPSGAPNGTLPLSTGPMLVSTSPTAELTALASGCLNNSSPCASPFVAIATQDASTAGVTISILKGGQTAPSVVLSFPAPAYRILSLGVGDFDGDGNADLALGLAGGTVEVYPGDGTGNFSTLAATLDFRPGLNDVPPEALAVAKFYGGSLPDIAVLDKDLGILGIFQNNSSTGSVSFQPVVTYPVSGTQALGMAVGDFNNDTYPDVAVSYPGFVSVLLNQSGTLGSPSTFPVSGFSINGPIGVGDFNGDGNMDLALTVVGDSVLVLPGDGSGNFASSPDAFIAGAGPTALAVADFNGDNKPDIAVADQGGNMVTVLLNGAANVSVPTLQEIVITPTNPSIPVGGTVQLTATGHYSDGSTQNLTDMVTWGSDGSLVTVSPQGLATGIAPVSLTSIFATFESFSNQIFITITPAPSAPTVTGVSPNSGPVTGGTPVTITGTNFTGATAVYFGLLSATPVDVVSSTQITVLSPSDSSGVLDVVVVTPGGTSAVTPADEFTYYVPLLITTLTLPNGDLGTSYSQVVTASQPATFAVTSGSLPPGLTLASSGLLSGTPTQAGSFTFTITANGTVGGNASQSYTVVISSTAAVNETISVNDTETVNALTLATPIGVAAPVAYFTTGSPLGFNSTTGSQQTVGVENIGAAGTSLNLSSVAVSTGAPFSVSSVNCFNGATQAAIPSNAFCTVTITYTGSSAATDTATLTFTDNAALSNLNTSGAAPNFTQSITLNGTGSATAPPVEPSATVSVPSNGSPLSEQITVTDQPFVWATTVIADADPVIDFSAGPTIGFNSASGTQTFMVYNTGQAALSLSPLPAVSGPGAGQYSLALVACSATPGSSSITLPSGGACTYSIAYTASGNPANDNATITFTDNAGLSNLTTTGSSPNFIQSILLSGSGSNSTTPGPPSATVSVPSNGSPLSESITVTDQVSVTAGPIVTGISPNNGPTGGGTSVTISGAGFTGATAVTFGATPAASFAVNSDTQITTTSPAGTGTVDITVTSPVATSPTSVADRFTYGTAGGTCASAAPVSVSLSPLNKAFGKPTYSGVVKITNIGSTTLGTSYFVVSGLPTGVTLLQPAGTTTCAQPVGSPYLAVPSIAPGATAQIPISFNNPNPSVGIQYTHQVLTGGTP